MRLNTTALTPALSPRRGGILGRLFRGPMNGGCWEVSMQTKTFQSLFPLPEGEGQGEGRAMFQT